MSAPRMIQILRCDCGACTAGRWKSAYFWRCRECLLESVGDPTLAAAADAGRAHLAEHHTPPPTLAQGHSRRCGVSLAACEANECVCAQNHTNVVSGPQGGVQRSSCDHCNDLCDYCGEIDGVCGRDFPCCSHENPLQAAYETTRSDT